MLKLRVGLKAILKYPDYYITETGYITKYYNKV